MDRLVAVVGPTGTGKSRLSIRLAQVFNGEIVNADSRQVYRHMDIGTAKPSPQELALLSHHLYSIVDPDEDFSLGQYQKLAFEAIWDIIKRNKLPVLAGGTGQYVWAVLDGWEVPEVPPDLQFRQSLETRTPDELYELLLQVDPESAQRIDRRNIRRMVRAIEVHRQTQIPFSSLQRKKSPPFNSLIIGLTASRTELYRRVDKRVDHMMKQGFVAEVESLQARGYDLSLPSMYSVGYRQIGRHLKGELTIEEAVKQIKTETHRIIRHQYAWFRLSDKRIHWFDVEKEIEPEVIDLVSRFLKGEPVDSERS